MEKFGMEAYREQTGCKEFAWVGAGRIKDGIGGITPYLIIPEIDMPDRYFAPMGIFSRPISNSILSMAVM